jgi:hypothetical protein
VIQGDWELIYCVRQSILVIEYGDLEPRIDGSISDLLLLLLCQIALELVFTKEEFDVELL